MRAEAHAYSRKHLWIVNHHATIPSKDGRYGRHLSLATHLRNHDWDTTIFLASTSHPAGEQRLSGARLRKRSLELGVPTVWIRTTAYGSSQVRRVVGMVLFAIGILLPVNTRGIRCPDVVLGSTVHLLAAWAACRLAKRHDVPFVFEIRDIWPETLIDLGQMKPSAYTARVMRWFALRLSKSASLVVSPLPGVRQYLDDNGLGYVPFAWVSNGVEPDEVVPHELIPRHDGFVMMYLGSHGSANGLETIIDAFDDFCSTSSTDDSATLRLVGEGPKKAFLQSHAEKLSHGKNIAFEPTIARSEVTRRAREADCLVVNLEDLPVYRYGISLNKLFDYLLSERPIIIATSALNNPVRDAGAGLCVPAGDRLALVDAMVQLRRMPALERAEVGRRGRSHVLEHYTYAKLACDLAVRLNGIGVPPSSDS